MSQEESQQALPNDFLHFRLAVTNCLKHIAESVSEKQFAEILSVIEIKPKLAQKLHNVMVKQLYGDMNASLEEILEEGSLLSGLTKVTKLLKETDIPADEKAWRPPGAVKFHLRSFDAEVIQRETDELEKRVIEVERENESLKKLIEERRQDLSALNNRVTRTLNGAPLALQHLENSVQQLESYLKIIADGSPKMIS